MPVRWYPTSGQDERRPPAAEDAQLVTGHVLRLSSEPASGLGRGRCRFALPPGCATSASAAAFTRSGRWVLYWTPIQRGRLRVGTVRRRSRRCAGSVTPRTARGSGSRVQAAGLVDLFDDAGQLGRTIGEGLERHRIYVLDWKRLPDAVSLGAVVGSAASTPRTDPPGLGQDRPTASAAYRRPRSVCGSGLAPDDARWPCAAPQRGGGRRWSGWARHRPASDVPG